MACAKALPALTALELPAKPCCDVAKQAVTEESVAAAETPAAASASN